MTPTDPEANMARKRKRIPNADGGLELQLWGPGGRVTEQVTVKEETEDPPADPGSKEEVASSTVVFAPDLAAEGNSTTGQEVPLAESSPTQVLWALAGSSNKLNITPFMIELDRIKLQKFELDMQHGTMKMKLKQEMEDELEKVRKSFEEKVKQEEIRFQTEQLYIGDAYQNLLRNKAIADEWAAMKRSLSEQWSISASDSSQVPKSTMQLFPLPCGPQQSCRAPAPTPEEPAMHTAQSGYHNKSVLRPNIPSIASHGLVTAASSASTASLSFRPHTGTSLPPGGTMKHPSAGPATYLDGSLPHMSATNAVSTADNAASSSTQRFAPSSSTPLRHPNQTFSEPSQHLAQFQAHPSEIPHSVSSTSSQGSRPHAGTPLRYPNQAPHFATSASTPPRFRPSIGTFLSRRAPAPGSVLRAPALHLRSHLPVIPRTSITGPVLSASPASLTFRPSADTLSRPVPGSCPSAIPSTSNPAHGPVRGTVADGNGASSSHANGNSTASDAGQWMVDGNAVIYLSDDD